MGLGPWSYPEEPEDEVLLFASNYTISIGRDGIAKQPESKSTSKYVDVFLNGKLHAHIYNVHVEVYNICTCTCR